MILDHSISLPHFFDNRWEHNGVTTPFDTPSHDDAVALHNLFDLSFSTKKSVMLVCWSWYLLSRGALFRHLVIRSVAQLEKTVGMFEASEAEVVRGPDACIRRVPLGWNVTHIKFLLAETAVGAGAGEGEGTASARARAGALRAQIGRLVACCPRLTVLLDGSPYASGEASPMGGEDVLGAVTFRGRAAPLRAVIWTYGGPTLQTQTPENTEPTTTTPSAWREIRHLHSYTLHGMADDVHSSSAAVSPIVLPNLVSLDLSLSWNNHRHWQQAAAQLGLPALRYLTVRAPRPGDAALTSTAVAALDEFLVVHGRRLTSLDIRITPRCVAQSHFLWAEPLRENLLDVCAVLARCPSLTELALSAGWFLEEEEQEGELGEGTEAREGQKDWHHPSIERIGLRDMPLEGGYGSKNGSSRGAPYDLTYAATQLLLGYRNPQTLLQRSVEALLGGPTSSEVLQHHPLSRIMRVFLGMRSARSIFGEGWKERAFPALESIHLLDRRGGRRRDVGPGWGEQQSSCVGTESGLDGRFIQDQGTLPSTPKYNWRS
jgi:hypothetical protein